MGATAWPISDAYNKKQNIIMEFYLQVTFSFCYRISVALLMASPWSSVIPVQPSAGMIQSELHYMASIRYPILTHPLALDRVFMLLSKAREAASRMSFQWVRLRTPKSISNINIKTIII